MKTIEITSTQNDLVKFAVKLQDSKYRKKEKLILVDGAQTIEGLVFDGIVFEYFFVKKGNSIDDKMKINNLVLVNDEILKKISTTKSPTQAVGIIKEPEIDKNIFKKLNKIALIDGIKDAGNLGTIIRSAVAFSIDGIILFNECVDLYNTKTLRATTQNIFKLPIIKTSDAEFVKELKKTHKLISTVVDSSCDFFNVELNDKFILAFGSEADGISQIIADLSDEKVTLEMDNNVESLNLGVCASIAFAIVRHKNKIEK
ncbi:MAG: RNA methyltransferase [Candidatus Gastranaerophilales bacterium]|nr:RNA methyltransferase [Candidatus Gastranaerophilales bacterium]